MPVSDVMEQRLSTKLVWVAIGFLFVALAGIGFTLFESWKLEGGAAAINDMGSERMRSYRIGYLLSEQVRDPSESLKGDLHAEMRRLEDVLAVIRRGDPARPLVLPRDPEIESAVGTIESLWAVQIKPLVLRVLEADDPRLLHAEMGRVRSDIEDFVGHIDRAVLAIERNYARHIVLLRFMQFGLIALAVAGTVVLIYLMFLLVVRPVLHLQEGMQRMTRGEFEARVPVETRDEFGELAGGFNRMASHLEELYATLEERVSEKTRSLAERNRELAALYDVTALLNESASIEEVCRGFLRKLMGLLGAEGGSVRLVDPETRQIHRHLNEGLAPEFARDEQRLDMDDWLGGETARHDAPLAGFMAPVRDPELMYRCRQAGYRTVSAFTIRFKRQLLGMFNLYFREQRDVSPQERQTLETLGRHLGVAIENQRLVARDRELAVFEERNLLAQQLHDSIAQSLAFLNIQVQMLEDSLRRNAVAEARDTVGPIREGIQESYDDVRELLVHFRTRVGEEEEIGAALRNMLERFEGQTGIRTVFRESGSGVPPPPGNRLQVLHILQEALSNVRKHSGASSVTLEMERDRAYRFRVRDDGRGFDPQHPVTRAESHIGLRIMRERAHRIGGALAVNSRPGKGTQVTLTVPVTQEAAA